MTRISQKKNIICFNLGKGISFLGTQLYVFMLAVMVLEVTKSAMSFSVILVVSMLPRIFFSSLAGVWADRFNRKKLIIISDAASALILLSLLVCNMILGYNIYLIYIFTFLLNTANVIFDITMSSSITSLFEEEKVQQICSISEGINSSCMILAPILGGMLAAFLDFNVFILINLISFTLSIMMESALSFKSMGGDMIVTAKKQKSILVEIRDVIVYIKQQKIILLLYTAVIVINICYSLGVNVAFPHIILNVLKMSKLNYGILNVMLSCGMLGSALVLSLIYIKKRYILIIATFFMEGICIFMIGFPFFLKNLTERNLFLFYAAVMFISGAAESTLVICVRTYLQKMIPEEKKGKVLGTLASFCNCVVPFSTLIAGTVMEILNPFILPLLSGSILWVLTIVVCLNKDMKKI